MLQNLTAQCIRPVLACDAGNRYIKWVNPSKQVKSILSCVAELDKYDSYDMNANCPHTVYIEIENGKRYLIGKDASQFGGQWYSMVTNVN
ncbi:MAG: hypothetical protein HC785_16490 [Calothrix sp. CSU_2_0]|nr:hypothetical protein [Calothrix sp. CSU_2_0]